MANLFEHREWTATACPSGRIPWARLIADLEAASGRAAEREVMAWRRRRELRLPLEAGVRLTDDLTLAPDHPDFLAELRRLARQVIAVADDIEAPGL